MFLSVACFLLSVGLVSVQGCYSSDKFLEITQHVCYTSNIAGYYEDNVKELHEKVELLLHEPELAALTKLILDQSDSINKSMETLQTDFITLQGKIDAVLLEQDHQKWNMEKILSIDPYHYEVSDLYQNHHFYIVSKANEAFDLHAKNDICKKHGGYLVEIDDPSEQDFVWKFVSAFGTSNLYYTGGNDIVTDGKFYWVNSGKPITNIKWKPNEPNNAGGNEDCMNIRIEGMNDAPCVRQCRYICEIPLYL